MVILPVLWTLLGITALVLLIAFICYRIVFYAKKEAPLGPDEYDIPQGDIYEPFRDKMLFWQKQMRALPSESFTITSFDGLKLSGKYFEKTPGAVIELMFHGYRGTAERDLSGGVQRCFRVGRSALVVDQRCSGRSGGSVITFGVREHRDCLAWVDFMVKHFGPDVKIILTGISMGAATVMTAAGKPLPPNVIGVLADCGFSSPEAIIREVIRQMGIPDRLGYPFVRLGALVFGGFDPEETSAVEALKNARVPVIFYHGEDDAFVPCDMSRECYAACASKKRLVTVPGAGHGLSYPKDPEGYLGQLRDFFGPEASHQKD